jgi:hypothetical protein
MSKKASHAEKSPLGSEVLPILQSGALEMTIAGLVSSNDDIKKSLVEFKTSNAEMKTFQATQEKSIASQEKSLASQEKSLASQGKSLAELKTSNAEIKTSNAEIKQLLLSLLPKPKSADVPLAPFFDPDDLSSSQNLVPTELPFATKTSTPMRSFDNFEATPKRPEGVHFQDNFRNSPSRLSAGIFFDKHLSRSSFMDISSFSSELRGNDISKLAPDNLSPMKQLDAPHFAT